jgi:hypothetical protein
MFFSAWIIVPVVLFVTLSVLFMAFIKWLAHSLEGYPTFLLQNQDPGTIGGPLALRIRSMPESSPVLCTFMDHPEVLARTMHEETIGRQARRI